LLGRRLASDLIIAAERAFVSGFDTIALVGAIVMFAAATLAISLVRSRDFVAARAAPAPAPAG
jgi:hypothetical protein